MIELTEDYGPEAAPGRFELGTDGPRLVVVGVDGSRTSLRARAYAAGVARRQGGAAGGGLRGYALRLDSDNVRPARRGADRGAGQCPVTVVP
ncbi:MAG TPA: hypothetical protein VFT31_06325 [Kribbella sp.]|nr:hypothetical protein [Kribbella sp.]